MSAALDSLIADGRRLHQAGDLAAAASCYRRALDVDGQSFVALHLLGVLSYQSGQLEEAERLIRAALARQPTAAGAHNNLGLVLDARGRTLEAIDAYRQAIGLRSDYAEAYSNLGIAYKILGRLDAAVAAYEEAVRLRPDFADALANLSTALRLLGRLDEAAAAAQRALDLAPDSPEALNNLGAVLADRGELDAAAEMLARAIARKRPFPEAQLNLSGVQRRRGRRAEAEALIRDVLNQQPDLAEAHNAMGELLQEQNRLMEAEQAYRRAVAARATFAEAHNNLGNTLRGLGRPADAEAAYRSAMQARPDYAAAAYNLCLLLQDQGRIEELEAILQKLSTGTRDDPVLGARLRLILEKLVPGWHVPMMNDTPRNTAYARAIERAAPGRHVLDIGTGAGLLALLAARAGAASITTCEMVRTVAARASEIVEANGFGGRINVIAKKSTEIQVGGDLPVPAEVLISEILSSDLVGEEALLSIEDAKARLIAPNARIIPQRVAMMGMIVGGPELELQSHVGTVEGFDLRPFNRLAPPRLMGHFQHWRIDVLSDPFVMLDFAGRDRLAGERHRLDVPITRAGRAVGVMQWLRLDLDEQTRFENHPLDANPASGWQNIVYCFAEPLALEANKKIGILVEHDRTKVVVCLDTRP